MKREVYSTLRALIDQNAKRNESTEKVERSFCFIPNHQYNTQQTSLVYVQEFSTMVKASTEIWRVQSD